MGKKGLRSLVRRPTDWHLFRTLGAGTIRSRLLVAFGLIVLLVAVVIITTSVVEGVQSGRQRVINQLQSVVTLKEAEINTWVQTLHSDLLVALNGETRIQQASTLLQQSAADRDLETGRGNLRTYLQSLIKDTHHFDELFLLDVEGNVVLSTEVTQEGKVFLQEGYFQCGLEGPCVQPPSYSSSLGQMVVMLARPVVGGSGETIGVMAGRASMAVLNGVMQERAGLGDTGETYLVGKNYAMLTASRFDETDVYARTDGVNAAIKEHVNGSGIYPNYRSASVVGVFRWLPDLQVALLAEQNQQEAFRSIYQTLIIEVGLAIVSVLLAIVASLFITRSITSPITALSKIAARIAGGDLDQAADVQDRGEIGNLARAFNSMTARLRDMLHSEQEHSQHLQSTIARYVTYMAQVARGDLSTRLALKQNGDGTEDPLIVLGRQLNETTVSMQNMLVEIRDAANSLSSASTEILASTTQQAAGATEQSASISQASTTVDEVKVIAEQSVARAQEVADAAQRTVQVSRAGQKTVQDTIHSMAQIKTRVEGIAENILALSEQTQQIGEIIATVNDIAAQSSMLALNASVEAARAGEHGRGFAVVAQEVRNLAEQSRQATAQVKAILSDIQRATNATVMATEEGTKGVEVGVQLASQTEAVIGQLSGVIDESAQAAMQMVAGGQQQASGMEQIALAMNSINQATVQSLASTRQAGRASQNLNDLARNLNRVVEGYKV
jgi:methyl-accepting chemotaxis protein